MITRFLNSNGERGKLMSEHPKEVDLDERFGFGENWKRFPSVLDDEGVAHAECSLKQAIGVETLTGKKLSVGFRCT